MAEDGSVVIKVRFETGDVSSGVEEIEAGCRRAGAAASRMGRSAARLRMDRDASAAGRAVRALADGVEGLDRQTQSVDTGRFDRQMGAVGGHAAGAAEGLDTAQLALEAVGLSMAGGLGGALRYGAALRTLAALGAGFGRTLQDGLESLARYDREAAGALGQLRGALSSVKSSLVTAFAPIATAVAPYLGKLCSMLATAANYVAMFFAVLGGRSTYMRATAATASAAAGISAVGTAATAASAGVYGLSGAVKVAAVSADALGNKTAVAVGGVGRAATLAAGDVRTVSQAVREAERNLSGLDEMNIWKVREDTGSAGGGGSGGGGSGGGLDIQDSAFTFEEVPVDAAFLEKMDWLREHMDGILTAAGAIGAAVLAWKISRAFGASLKTALGLATAVGGAVLAVRGYWDAWTNGIDLTNLTETFGGLALVIGGVGVAAGPAAAAVAALVGGVGTAVLALREWIKTGELTDEALKALVGGILLVGGAISLLTGSWTPLAIAAAAAVVVAVRARWDEIKAWTARTWTAVKEQISGRWDEIKRAVGEKATAVWEKVKEVFGGIQEKIRSAVASAREAVSDKFEQIRSIIQEKITAAREKTGAVFEGIRACIQEKIESAKEKVKAAIDAIKGFFDFEWSLPHIQLPHFSLSGSFSLWPLSVPKVSVSWYAKGGIVDGATLIGAGEAGREAIVPLERHTQWIDRVAEQLALRLGCAGLEDGLRRIAERLAELPGALERLGQAMPAPVLASGTVTPPRAAYMDGPAQGLADANAQLRQLLAGVGQSAAGRAAQYTFIGQIDRRVLFREVLDEAKARRAQSGKNPFLMGE